MSTHKKRALENTGSTDPQSEPCPADATPPTTSFNDELINILLVDDEPRNLTVLETVLEDPGYRLVCAESAEKALLALVVEEFALLVLDIQMPGMSGFELAQMIKQRKKTAALPIIFLTAYYSEVQHVLEGYGTGAVDYLHKPINPTILRSKVAVFAELHRKSRESARANRTLRDEVTARRRAEEKLRQLNDELEHRVADRTAELVQVNTALSESERRLRVATEAAALGTWEYDYDTGVGQWSERVRMLLGVGPDERASLELMLDRVHRDDRSTVLAAIHRSTDPAGDGRYAVEYRVVLPDGTVNWLEEIGETVFTTVDGRRKAADGSGVVRNVTDRKRAEEAVRNSEAFNRGLMDGSADCVMVLDTDGRLLHMNGPGLSQMEIHDFGPLCGHEWSSLWPSETQEQVRGSVERARSGERSSFSVFCPTAKGKPKWWDVIVSPVRDVANGQVVRVLSVSRDITERMRAEEAILASERRLRLALRAGQTGVWDWEFATDRLTWSEESHAIHAMQPGSFEGTLEAFNQLVHEDDRERVFETRNAAIDRGEIYTCEFRIVRPDGIVRWVTNLGIIQFDAAGKPASMTGTITDVTERRAAEQTLLQREREMRSLADNTPDILTRFDRELRYVFVNSAIEKETGRPRDKFLGRSMRDLGMPDGLCDLCEQSLWSVFETKKHASIEFGYPCPGGVRQYATRLVPEFGPSGEAEFVLGVTQDVTDRKQAEEERERLLAAAESANRMKDEFLATLSHELRTPLNAIVGWAKILRSGKIDAEDLEEGLSAIERNSHTQTRIIEDLLDISRIISGKLLLEVQRIQLTDVIEAALSAVLPAANAKEIRILKVLDSLAAPVTGDAARLQQIVWNLLSNAVKFTPKGGNVQVLLERVNSHVEISVIDTGIGIKPEFLPHVFDRFRQADASTTRRHAGLGLGLAIVKQLVETHGGSIRAKSPGEGQGSTFTVTLPITVVHPERSRPEPIRREEGDSTEDICQGALAGLKVLVVDDEPDARRLVHRVLADCQAQVAVASSAAEALDLMKRFHPDVIVSDIGMPEQDGYDLIRQVRAEPATKDIPAAALTAFARPEERRRSLLAGFQTHIAKPVDPAELTAVVASLAFRTGKTG